jgi:hypothetical protein
MNKTFLGNEKDPIVKITDLVLGAYLVTHGNKLVDLESFPGSRADEKPPEFRFLIQGQNVLKDLDKWRNKTASRYQHPADVAYLVNGIALLCTLKGWTP